MGEPRRARDPPERRPMWGRARLGDACGTRGAPGRRGPPRRGLGAECEARGLGAAGLGQLSPFSAGACGLGWVPAVAIRAAAAAEGRVVRRGAVREGRRVLPRWDDRAGLCCCLRG